MIIKNRYPVCEYDTSRNPMIKPSDFLSKTLPSKCVITFFRKELNQFVEDKKLSVIDYLYSEVLDIPIYEYNTPKEKICITMPFATAPGAAGTIEELYAMGCNKFIVCGGAGAMKKDSLAGEIFVPTAAVRDEGTSYHYLEPSREVECHKMAIDVITSGLEKLGIPYTTGKTWTTDAMYRETPEMITLRRKEGCVTVEMEAAAFFAVSKYYDIPLAQLLYAGDDVSGEKWDARNWNNQESVRSNMIFTAIKLMEEL
ncbi:nucleoside phosphorylase [Parablautia muri]|uniref:Uridine phosphorylase n=1 Tax=Parablautia muri TaxID=2320879 RepID=A0A9X5BF41_9FIRM|nr:nucleoside phosphorylase [Parablautia muri]NBJ92884.1 purine-nucleoside phosphorylase [Parablautia muri]